MHSDSNLSIKKQTKNQTNSSSQQFTQEKNKKQKDCLNFK